MRFLLIFIFLIYFPIVSAQNIEEIRKEGIDVEKLIQELEQKKFYGNNIILIPLDLILKLGLAYYNPIQLAELDIKSAESKLQGSLVAFESSLITSYTTTKSAPAVRGETQNGLEFNISTANNLTTSFTKNTFSGIRYDISLNIIDSNSSTYLLNGSNASLQTESNASTFSNSIAINIPLAKDLGKINTIKVIREGINIKEKQKDLLTEVFNFIEIFNNIYWDLKRIYAMYEVQYERTLLTESLYKQSKLRQETNVGDNIEVMSSLNNLQNNKIALVNIWNAIIDVNEQIKDVFNLLDLDLFIYPSDVFPNENLTEKPIFYLEKIKKIHPNFINNDIRKARNEVSMLESNNEKKPDIDLDFRYSILGGGTDVAEAIDNLSIVEFDTYQLGLNWRIPFGNRSAKAKMDEVLYENMKIKKQLSTLESSTKLEIRKRLRDLKTKKEEIMQLTDNIKILKQSFEREKIRYEVGSSTAILLQEAQTQVVSSQFNLVKAQSTYAILYNQMLIDTGEIFTKYDIPIPNNLKEKNE